MPGSVLGEELFPLRTSSVFHTSSTRDAFQGSPRSPGREIVRGGAGFSAAPHDLDSERLGSFSRDVDAQGHHLRLLDPRFGGGVAGASHRAGPPEKAQEPGLWQENASAWLGL